MRWASRAGGVFSLALLAAALAGCTTVTQAQSRSDAPPRVLVAVHDDPRADAEADSPAFLPVAPAPAALPSPSPSPAASPASVPSALPLTVGLDLPILMYHYVRDMPASSTDAVGKDLSVSPRNLTAQVAMLQQLNVTAVSMDDVLEYLYGRKAPPARPVVLTFDDGYDDIYTQAYPILAAGGMAGTAYVISDFVGQPGYMTWDQLRDLSRHGWSIQSHTISHPDLRVVADAELQRQLRESKARIERELGLPVQHLNYPAGKHDARVMAAAGAAGYRTAVTVDYGTRLTPRQLFDLPRVRVHGADSPSELRARLMPASWR